MKSCTYCGRQNDDAALGCIGCGGAEFKPLALEIPPQKRRLWISPLLRLGGVALMAHAFLYLVTHSAQAETGDLLDPQHDAAMIYFYKCLFFGIAFFALGWFLKGRAIERQRA